MLRAEGLQKHFGALAVTRDVSLQVAAGTRHAIIGPNGAGKTTLFNLLAGELTPSAGHIYIDGHDVTRAHESLGNGRSRPDVGVLVGAQVERARGVRRRQPEHQEERQQ